MASDVGRGAFRVEPGPTLTPTLPSPIEGEGKWRVALAALRQAEREVAAFKRAEPKGVAFAVQCRLDEAFSDLVCAQNEALERLMRAPAPDPAALSLKIALAVDEQVWELPDGERAMAQLKRDARRLRAPRRA